MTLPRILALALITLPLVGCATFGEPTTVQAVAPPPAPPVIPAVPADVASCLRGPTELDDKALTAGEVERLWKTDRLALVKVNSCLRRIVCQYQAVRKDIGQVADAATCATTKKPQPKRTIWQRATGKATPK